MLNGELADVAYQQILAEIADYGSEVTTRGSKTKSHITLPVVTFVDFPLVTLRKTAWKKAIQEMQWFMSGECTCPEALQHWWAGQLDKHGRYLDGYATQLRYFRSGDGDEYFDQYSPSR